MQVGTREGYSFAPTKIGAMPCREIRGERSARELSGLQQQMQRYGSFEKPLLLRYASPTSDRGPLANATEGSAR